MVDDREDSAEAVALLLNTLSCETRIAANGDAAVAEFSTFEPHLVVLDLQLGNEDGCEVLKRLSQDRQRTPVTVCLTGQSDQRTRCLDAGFDHYMVKPADFQEIEQLVGKARGRLDAAG